MATTFGRPHCRSKATSTEDAGLAPAAHFIGYDSERCIVGLLDLQDERMSDRLRQGTVLRLEEVMVADLDDGQRRVSGDLAIEPADLIAVEAGRTRTDLRRRVPTMSQLVLLDMGPYIAQGELHGRRGAPPLAFASSRGGWAALTDVTLRFRLGRQQVTRPVETLLVNMHWITAATALRDRYPLPQLTNQVPLECRRPPKIFTFGGEGGY